MNPPPMLDSPSAEASLQARIATLETSCRRYQRQAALAISLLSRGSESPRPGPLVCPVPIPPPVFNNDGPTLHYHLDHIEQDDARGLVHGWAFTLESGVEPSGTTTILLHSHGDWWALPVSLIERPDVTKAFSFASAGIPTGFETHFSLPRHRHRMTGLRIYISGLGWNTCSPELPLV